MGSFLQCMEYPINFVYIAFSYLSPAEHDMTVTCSLEAWMWSSLRVAQAEMSEYITRCLKIELC